jgi:hypothetical protein
MKKLTFLSMIWFFSFSAARTQDLMSESGKAPNSDENSSGSSKIIPVKTVSAEHINILVKKSFESDFVNAADVEWLKWGKFDQADFEMNGHALKAYYDTNGDLVGTTQDKTFADLPVKGQNEILNKYGDYKIGLVSLYTDNPSTVSDLLGSDQVTDEDLYFVELIKGKDRIVVQVTPFGEVSLITQIS